MSVIIAGYTSALLGFWAAKERALITKANKKADRLRSIPVVPVSGLKSLLPHQDAKKLVFLRGLVMPVSFSTHILGGTGHRNSSSSDSSSSSSDSSSDASNTASNSASNTANTLRSTKTNQEVLVVEERTTHIYSEEFFYRTKGSTKVVSRARKQVPFVIVDQLSKPSTEFVVVNLEGLDHHSVPLQRVSIDRRELYNHVKMGIHLQVEALTEEAILPPGSVVTAVGIFTTENGVPTIKPSDKLDYFLTSKTKEEMVQELRDEVEVLSKKGDFLTKVSVGLAGYAVTTVIIRFIRNLYCEIRR